MSLDHVVMNLFHLDKDPEIAVTYLGDTHIGLSIEYGCQMLANVANEFLAKPLIESRHLEHPMAQWVSETYSNWYWTVLHVYALLDEHKLRFHRPHILGEKYLGKLTSEDISKHVVCSREYNPTEPPRVVADAYKNMGEDTVSCYRYYYARGKRNMHKFTHRDTPPWLFDAKYYNEN